MLPETIEISRFIIWQDGSFEFELGSLPIPRGVRLKLGPVELTVTNMHLGSHEQEHSGAMRQYKYFGFDGMLNVNPGGIDARGEGIQFYFTVDGGTLHTFLRISSIHIDLIIPGTASKEKAALLLEGYLAMKHDGAGSPVEEYVGSVVFEVPKLKMGGAASLSLNPNDGSFLADAGIELSNPIPLGGTGLGIYGFRGLIGRQYLPSKANIPLPEEALWYQYYKAPQMGINQPKMANEDGFSLGAGVSIATTFDSGRVFSSRLFFLLGLPQVFLLEGRAAILSKRLGLDATDEPPFYALMEISPTSFAFHAGVDYKIPDSGRVLSLQGELALAFFYGNATGWYINIGQDQPEEKRVQAKLFNLFRGYAFLMLSSGGIKAGAGASFEFNKKYGPVSLGLGAYLDLGAEMSFKPFQLGGFISLGGYVYLKVFGFKLGLDVSATLAAEAPKPFIITGKFRIKINLPWPFPDIKIKVKLSWKINPNLNKEELELLDDKSAQALHIVTKRPYELKAVTGGLSNIGNLTNFVIPQDCFIDIEFRQPVKPYTENLGGVNGNYEYKVKVSPKKAKSRQVIHELSVEKVEILHEDGSGSSNWVNYHIYDGILPVATSPAFDPNTISSLKNGYWQMTYPKRYNKLRLLAQNMLSYMESGTDDNMTIEAFGYNGGDIMCYTEQLAKVCQDWESEPLGTEYPQNLLYPDRSLRFMSIAGIPKVVKMPNPFGKQYSLMCVLKAESIEIFLPENSPCLTLKLSTLADQLTVELYGRDASNSYFLISSTVYLTKELLKPIEYDNLAQPVAKIVLVGGACHFDVHGYFQHLCSVMDTDYMNTAQAEYQNAQNAADAAATACTNATPSDAPLLCHQAEQLQMEADRLLEQYNNLVAFQAIACSSPQPDDVVVCSTFIHEVCWMGISDYEYNQSLPDFNSLIANLEALSDGLNKTIQPIWRPNTNFAIRILTKDKLTDNNGDLLHVYENEHVYAFRTAGPIGHFHESDADYALLPDAEKDKYPIANLKHYVNYERSYPNADGNLVNAKPLYYNDPRLLLFFRRDYVYNMYRDYATYNGLPILQSTLNAIIKDPADGSIESPSVEWELNDFAQATLDDVISNNLLNSGQNCTGVPSSAYAMGFNAKFNIGPLKPSKLYTAIFNAEFEGQSQEVHRYGFQTSRYGSFFEHVTSYYLYEDENGEPVNAFYHLQLTFGAVGSGGALDQGIASLTDVLDEQSELRLEYPDPYDRMVYGILQLHLPPPEATEINLIWDADTQLPRGILVRSPEPFNDPKMPADELQGTFALETLIAGSLHGGPYINLFSKDGSCIFVSNDALEIFFDPQNPAGYEIQFRFEYKLFNGDSYDSIISGYLVP